MIPPFWLYAFSSPLVPKHAQMLTSVKVLKPLGFLQLYYILLLFC